MIVIRRILLFVFMLIVLALPACVPPASTQADATQTDQKSGDIPTWTPRSEDLTQAALPTTTQPASVLNAPTATQAATDTPAPAPTLKTVTFALSGGNLNVRRGPSLGYNYSDMLYDGDVATVIGRDRISRWLLIELPGKPGSRGWVTTETQYSTVNGDVGSLPFIAVEPAIPAFIRNCTKHELWIMPDDVKLLTKYDAPDNEEHFYVGVHQVYDMENPKSEPIIEVSLSEGKTVDIQYDWVGDKSKCE